MPALVQQYLGEVYDVEYSISSCRQLLKEAGLSYQKTRRIADESDEDEQEVFHDVLKKKRREMDGIVVCIDQTKKICPSRVAYHMVSTRHAVVRRIARTTRLDVSLRRDHRVGDRFLFRFEEYVTADHTKHFILALCKEFDDDLIVVLDGVPYF